MLGRLFPKQIDNTYRGSWVAIWLLIPVLLLKLTIGVNVMGINPWVSNRDVIIKADGVPLDTFSREVQEIVIFLFASWGLGLVLLCVFCVAALIRYRAMIPFVILVLTVEQIGRKAIGALTLSPSGSSDHPSIGAMINWGFSAALVIALALSLTTRRDRPVK